MEFNELFEKFKNNTATEEEKNIVEEEIKKNKLISEYLSEHCEEDFVTEAALNTESMAEIKTVRKAVKKRNIIIISSAVAIVIALLLSFELVVKPFVNSRYYNPNNDDNIIYSLVQLHYPLAGANISDIQNIGTGKYNFKIEYQDIFDCSKQEYNASIDKNVLDLSHFAAQNYKNSFRRQVDDVSKDFARKTAALEKLPEATIVKAYITFNSDMSMEEYLKKVANSDILKNTNYQAWLAVKASSDENNEPSPIIGFPAFGEHGADGLPVDFSKITADELENQFKNLLKGHIKNYTASKLEDKRYFDFDKKVLDYVQKNGVKAYGMAIIAPPKVVEEIMKQNYCGLVDIEKIGFRLVLD